MFVRFVKLNPSENITLLVLSPVPREKHRHAASKLMAMYPDAEQVGYLEPPQNAGSDARLQMMGGEFCGNASMATAAYIANGRDNISLDVSGAYKPVVCGIKNTVEGTFGCVDMPLPILVRAVSSPIGNHTCHLTEMRFEGISHYIYPCVNIDSVDTAVIEKSLLNIAADNPADAVGLILYDESNRFIKPLVYVRSTDSLVWERGCGSGTAAVGAYISYKNQSSVDVKIRQPGGVIGVSSEFRDHKLEALKIEGKIEILGEYEAEIEI